MGLLCIRRYFSHIYTYLGKINFELERFIEFLFSSISIRSKVNRYFYHVVVVEEVQCIVNAIQWVIVQVTENYLVDLYNVTIVLDFCLQFMQNSWSGIRQNK